MIFIDLFLYMCDFVDKEKQIVKKNLKNVTFSKYSSMMIFYIFLLSIMY